ncbi:putative 5-formyltetrahydrofolate cyclo-ligase [Roseovarius sp. THAF27]|uniref:5-formyltetrahydrofolate cyclo-ligase n=1 Tax=Roseovarius sp. THAF27 TaxID=2587850 RepID=UPI0012695004|nr:5-formyltetrahydrofolate cyclo-ligase [Roseovarius sp. THAF27]QFT79208.1 putative 5-formyltetrahydrofolate cyclo-ligase [Roseovarius sp. THAF27]
MSGAEDDPGGEPPCFAQNLVGGHIVDAQTWADVAQFRKSDRARLYALRKELSQDELAGQAAAAMATLTRVLGDVAGQTVAGYWPIRGELDLRPWLRRAIAAGAQVALPVVVEKGRAVAFHLWHPGAKMTRGIWNIPVPAEARAVTPDIVIAPLLGVDDGCYRLGNGGGYYDMTLAGLAPRPRVIGVGHDFCPVQTIFPQPWDVPMDEVILGDGSHVRRAA